MIPQISAAEAVQMLSDDDRAVLVDVRTEAEWTNVGVPDAAALGRPVRFVSWTLAGGVGNPYFLDQATDGLAPDTPLLLLCRSGGRSQAAAEALLASGFTSPHNIVGGFEGAPQPDGTHSGGWLDTIGGSAYHPAQ